MLYGSPRKSKMQIYILESIRLDLAISHMFQGAVVVQIPNNPICCRRGNAETFAQVSIADHTPSALFGFTASNAVNRSGVVTPNNPPENQSQQENLTSDELIPAHLS